MFETFANEKKTYLSFKQIVKLIIKSSSKISHLYILKL